MYDAVVIGGGIAGLTAALMLKNNGMNVRVLEAQDRPGGNIKTLVENGIHMETGPHSFMGSSEYTWKLVEKLQMEDAVEPATPASKNRYIYRRGKLNPLPMGPMSFIGTPLLSPAAKLRLMAEPLVPNGAKEEDTAWEFFCRRFGKEAATYIMTPFISGVYAGDVKMLGARAAFAKFWKFEKDAGSMILGAFKYMKNKRKRLRAEGLPIRRGLYSFHGGLGTITGKLAEALSEEIETNQPVKKIVKGKDGYIIENKNKTWKARYVVIAVPPPAAGSILKESLPEVEDTFAGIPMSPVSLVHWTAPENGKPFPDGFGFLMPRLFGLRVLGTLFPSKLFKERVPNGRQLFATFYGGMTDPEAMDLDDNRLESLLLEEHRRIFNRSLEDTRILKILRYPGAIPQLLPDHPEKMESVQTVISSKMPGVVLAGNYLTGVGIEHAVESGFRAAEGIGGTAS